MNAHIANNLVFVFRQFIDQFSHIADVLIVQKFADLQHVLILKNFQELFLQGRLFKFQTHSAKY